MCIREPVGVVAIACPDEKPLLSFVSLIAPAIVRSNAVIVIPSEKNPIPGMIQIIAFLPGMVTSGLTFRPEAGTTVILFRRF